MRQNKKQIAYRQTLQTSKKLNKNFTKYRQTLQNEKKNNILKFF